MAVILYGLLFMWPILAFLTKQCLVYLKQSTQEQWTPRADIGGGVAVDSNPLIGSTSSPLDFKEQSHLDDGKSKRS